MNFEPCNCILKIRESIGSSLGSVGVHSLTFSYTPRSMKCDSQASLLAYTFANLCFDREPKVRVAIAFVVPSICLKFQPCIMLGKELELVNLSTTTRNNQFSNFQTNTLIIKCYQAIMFIPRFFSSNILIISLVLGGWSKLIIQLWNKIALTWEVGTRCP